MAANVLGLAEGGEFSTNVYKKHNRLNLAQCLLKVLQPHFWQTLVMCSCGLIAESSI